MSGFFRLAIAATLVAGFGTIAQAASHSRRAPNPDAYYALYDQAPVHRPAYRSGTVPPSESGTVMGLRVPR